MSIQQVDTIVNAAGTGAPSLPNGASIPTIISNPATYTPVFQNFGTVTSVNVRYRKEGSFLFVWGNFTSGTASAADITIGLPTSTPYGVPLIDTTQFGLFLLCGEYGRNAAAALFVPTVISSDNANVYIRSSSDISVNLQGTVIGGTEYQTFWFRVPIAGWTATGNP